MAKLDRFIIDDTTYEIAPEIAPLFNSATSYSVGDCVIHDAVLYKFTANHAAGAWTGNDVEAIEVADRLNKISDSVAPEFSASASYTAGSYVYKNGVLYRFTADHTGAWTGSDAAVVTVGGEVENLEKAFYVSMTLDTSKSRNAYPSKVIDTVVSYTNSSATITFENIIRVFEGKSYTVKITNAATPASSNNRDSVIVDESNTIKQVIEIQTTPNQTNVINFTSDVDGFLILAVDKNYTNLEISGYEIFNDVFNIAQEGSAQGKYVRENSLTIGAKKTTPDPVDIDFKANHTYVIIIKTDAPNNPQNSRSEIGISGITSTKKIFPVNGYDCIKYTIGDSDVHSHIWIYNPTNATKSYTYVIEEWNYAGGYPTSEPNTIIIAGNTSSAEDKYISRYICDGTDDQIEIQAAIDELSSTTGGRVLLCDGEYVINTVTDTGNAEIGYIGLNLTYPENRHYISIEGVSKPLRVSDHEIKLGATIFLAAASVSSFSDNQHITVIGALPVNNDLQRLGRGINLTIKNIGINIPFNKKAIRCIDAEYCSALQVENVAIGISANQTVNTSPNVDCIGIRGLGGWNYGIYYTLRCVKILGMGVAFDLGGEHMLMEQCAVRYSGIPYRFYKYGDVSKMAHNQTMINCCEESCEKSIVFGANSKKPAFSIIDYNIEYRPTEHSGNWARTQKALEENPGDICGEILFTVNKENYINVTDVDFWESGSGVNVITRNQVDKKYGTTANRPTNPNLLQQYYDTSINKLILYTGSGWVDAHGTSV